MTVVKIPVKLVEEIRKLGVEDVNGFIVEAVREKISQILQK